MFKVVVLPKLFVTSINNKKMIQKHFNFINIIYYNGTSEEIQAT
jgi:hypothetical protein